MNIIVQRAFGRHANEPADRHVFADLADQCLAGIFNTGTVDGQCGQCRHVSRILRRHQFSELGGQRQKIIVLRDEIGFAIDFNNGTQFLVA